MTNFNKKDGNKLSESEFIKLFPKKSKSKMIQLLDVYEYFNSKYALQGVSYAYLMKRLGVKKTVTSEIIKLFKEAGLLMVIQNGKADRKGFETYYHFSPQPIQEYKELAGVNTQNKYKVVEPVIEKEIIIENEIPQSYNDYISFFNDYLIKLQNEVCEIIDTRLSIDNPNYDLYKKYLVKESTVTITRLRREIRNIKQGVDVVTQEMINNKFGVVKGLFLDESLKLLMFVTYSDLTSILIQENRKMIDQKNKRYMIEHKDEFPND